MDGWRVHEVTTFTFCFPTPLEGFTLSVCALWVATNATLTSESGYRIAKSAVLTGKFRPLNISAPSLVHDSQIFHNPLPLKTQFVLRAADRKQPPTQTLLSFGGFLQGRAAAPQAGLLNDFFFSLWWRWAGVYTVVEERVRRHVLLTSPFAVSNLTALKGVQSQADVCPDLFLGSGYFGAQRTPLTRPYCPLYNRQKQLMVVLVLTHRAPVHFVYSYYHQSVCGPYWETGRWQV